MPEVDIDGEVFLPKYRQLLNNKSDIRLLWGGRDSGKSRDTAMRKIVQCMGNDYFRELLIKKTFNSIKDSQWQTIKDIVDEWGLSHLFTFKTNPLEIDCVNGNKFIARGCDDPAKMKSIQNPSGCWIEEGNQLTESDWLIILTTLRSNLGSISIDITFNPECEENYEDFWMYKYFFKDHFEKGIYSFDSKIETITSSGIILQLTYTSVHSTYHDNRYVTEQRKAIHESYELTNPYYYRTYTLGLWGNVEAKSPWCNHYKPSKHESVRAVFNPNHRITFVVDWNLDPFAVTMRHRWRDEYGPHTHTFDEASIQGGSVPTMIDYILESRYVKCLPGCILSGDYRGNERSLERRDHASRFMQLADGLRLSSSQVVVSPNPLHTKSRNDVNYVLLYHPDFIINPETCKGMCRDMRNVQSDRHGSIVKQNRNDPNQRSDFLDCLRYDIQNFELDWMVKDQQIRNRK